jgi:hypothetical protein
VSDLQQKTTLTAEAVANLIEQFRDKQNLGAFLSAFTDQIQDAENAAFELIDERTLDAAVGVQLDGLGEIIGLERGGLDDDDYRARLKAQIKINSSSGTINEILEIVALIESAPDDFKELYPASIITTIYTPTEDPQLIALAIRDSRSAGVRSHLHYSLDAETKLFTLATGDTTESSPFLGLANDGGTTGGFFADALEA